jgi:hypothetical protein
VIILESFVYNKIYFEAHAPGTVDLVIDPAIRYADGPITMTVAAAEMLLANLDSNAEHARFLARKNT